MDELIHALNNCISSPGLAIHGASSPTVKYANTFQFKANGRISPAITTADAPSLALATHVLPFPNGTPVVAPNTTTGYTRVYSLIATLPVTGSNTVTPTFSWLASQQFLTTSDLVNYGYIPQPSASNQAIVGVVIIANATGSDFVPGTTDLDASNLTVTYINNSAQAGE